MLTWKGAPHTLLQYPEWSLPLPQSALTRVSPSQHTVASQGHTVLPSTHDALHMHQHATLAPMLAMQSTWTAWIAWMVCGVSCQSGEGGVRAPAAPPDSPSWGAERRMT
jgi:hypothetical protein